MRETIDLAASGSDLRAKLEELAADLVLTTPESSSIEGFARRLSILSQRAGAEGYSEAARIASALAQNIASQTKGEELEGELNRLRLALEEKTAPSSVKLEEKRATNYSLAQDPE